MSPSLLIGLLSVFARGVLILEACIRGPQKSASTKHRSYLVSRMLWRWRESTYNSYTSNAWNERIAVEADHCQNLMPSTEKMEGVPGVSPQSIVSGTPRAAERSCQGLGQGRLPPNTLSISSRRRGLLPTTDSLKIVAIHSILVRYQRLRRSCIDR